MTKSNRIKTTYIILWTVLVLIAVIGCGSAQPTQQPVEVVPVEPVSESEKKPEKTASTNPAHFWDLTHLYPSDAAWEKALNDLKTRLPEVEALAGTLGKSPTSLKKALETYFEIRKSIARLFTYAGQRFDEDMRNAKGLEMQQKVRRVATDFRQKLALKHLKLC